MSYIDLYSKAYQVSRSGWKSPPTKSITLYSDSDKSNIATRCKNGQNMFLSSDLIWTDNQRKITGAIRSDDNEFKVGDQILKSSLDSFSSAGWLVSKQRWMIKVDTLGYITDIFELPSTQSSDTNGSWVKILGFDSNNNAEELELFTSCGSKDQVFKNDGSFDLSAKAHDQDILEPQSKFTVTTCLHAKGIHQELGVKFSTAAQILPRADTSRGSLIASNPKYRVDVYKPSYDNFSKKYTNMTKVDGMSTFYTDDPNSEKTTTMSQEDSEIVLNRYTSTPQSHRFDLVYVISMTYEFTPEVMINYYQDKQALVTYPYIGEGLLARAGSHFTIEHQYISLLSTNLSYSPEDKSILLGSNWTKTYDMFFHRYYFMRQTGVDDILTDNVKNWSTVGDALSGGSSSTDWMWSPGTVTEFQTGSPYGTRYKWFPDVSFDSISKDAYSVRSDGMPIKNVRKSTNIDTSPCWQTIPTSDHDLISTDLTAPDSFKGSVDVETIDVNIKAPYLAFKCVWVQMHKTLYYDQYHDRDLLLFGDASSKQTIGEDECILPRWGFKRRAGVDDTATLYPELKTYQLSRDFPTINFQITKRKNFHMINSADSRSTATNETMIIEINYIFDQWNVTGKILEEIHKITRLKIQCEPIAADYADHDLIIPPGYETDVSTRDKWVDKNISRINDAGSHEAYKLTTEKIVFADSTLNDFEFKHGVFLVGDGTSDQTISGTDLVTLTPAISSLKVPARVVSDGAGGTNGAKWTTGGSGTVS